MMHVSAHCCDEAANHQLPIAVAFWLIQGEMFKLNAKCDTDLLLYSVNHFESDGHTVHTLTQWHLPSPLTSTVKSSLFTHVHSSPLSLAARLLRCRVNHSHYITMAGLFLDRPCILNKCLWREQVYCYFPIELIAPCFEGLVWPNAQWHWHANPMDLWSILGTCYCSIFWKKNQKVQPSLSYFAENGVVRGLHLLHWS